VKTVKKLNESELIKLIKKNLIEQTEETSADNCDQSKGTNSFLNNWRTMPNEQKKEKLEKLKSELIPLISKCIQEYKIWFKNPQTIRKFKNNKEFNVVKNIGSFLDKIKNIKFHYTYLGKPESKLYAYVTPKDLTTINYFFPNFHEVNTSIVSLYELTKHEIGHLKDSYFKLNGFKTYIQTINTY